MRCLLRDPTLDISKCSLLAFQFDEYTAHSDSKCIIEQYFAIVPWGVHLSLPCALVEHECPI